MIVGLTGGIATGKSTVSQMFRELGAPIVDADVIARTVVEPGRPAWRDIVSHFGEDILLSDRTIDRPKLGGIVFSNAAERDKLNRIVHPRVRKEAGRQVAEYLRKDPNRPVIQDVPLLIETGLYRQMDKVILVYVDEQTQLHRLMERDGVSEKEAMKRIRAQMPIEDKKSYADYVIDNRGGLDQTRRQVMRIWEELRSLT
ncbi:dephospho-CoA kinase [Effusibacillus lacus]|uniref:Dephospho-CoA kinase n=1 Tax=Effusibacillus lacus TaxID=1348429 RepID=A0A292YI16_9BACL|nr:dephospho-CoA kinase [Effusibacillus lacus]TCS73610.1 dephospho-CoA kinase [Effusibacillus lacus]GAX89498.1 dephospho-CoA kinase [Effusibacillus lacus]